MCRDHRGHVPSGNFYPRALNSTAFAISRIEWAARERSKIAARVVPSWCLIHVVYFTARMRSQVPLASGRIRNGRTPADGGKYKYILAGWNVGNSARKENRSLKNTRAVEFLLFSMGISEGKDDDFRTKRGRRCVLARGKNFSSSLTRPGKGVEKSRGVGDEVHLASRWKGCSIRGKSKAGKGTRLGKTTTSRNGESVVSFRFFRAREEIQGSNNGRTNGKRKGKFLLVQGLTFARIRSVELISTGLETGDARTSPARLPRSGDSDLWTGCDIGVRSARIIDSRHFPTWIFPESAAVFHGRLDTTESRLVDRWKNRRIARAFLDG